MEDTGGASIVFGQHATILSAMLWIDIRDS